MTRNTAVRFAVSAVLAIALATAGMAPAAAQSSDDGLVDDLFTFDDEGDDGIIPDGDTIGAVARGTAERAYNFVFDGDDETTASDHADDVQETFNNNSEALETWTNRRTNASDDWNVIRIKFETDDSSEYRYVVADVNATTHNYTDARMMGIREFRDTGRTVDHTYSLEPAATRGADEELRTFVDEYAKPNEDLKQPFIVNIAAEYGGKVHGGPLPGGV